jgi:hypothetical protein
MEISSKSFDSSSRSLNAGAHPININSSSQGGTLEVGRGFHGVIHRLKVGVIQQHSNGDISAAAGELLADWTMSNVGTSDNVSVQDTSGKQHTLNGGKLLRDQEIKKTLSTDLGTSFAFSMGGKSVIEITNECNLGLSRFPSSTMGVWFSPGVKDSAPEVILAQGDDDVGLLCTISNNKLSVSWWTYHDKPLGTSSSHVMITEGTLET